MTVALVTQILNGAFALIAALRRQGMTNANINTRLDQVDNGGQAITADEVRVQLKGWQDAIDAGRQIP